MGLAPLCNYVGCSNNDCKKQYINDFNAEYFAYPVTFYGHFFMIQTRIPGERQRHGMTGPADESCAYQRT
jgi:hypothetical protein